MFIQQAIVKKGNNQSLAGIFQPYADQVSNNY